MLRTGCAEISVLPPYQFPDQSGDIGRTEESFPAVHNYKTSINISQSVFKEFSFQIVLGSQMIKEFVTLYLTGYASDGIISVTIIIIIVYLISTLRKGGAP